MNNKSSRSGKKNVNNKYQKNTFKPTKVITPNTDIEIKTKPVDQPDNTIEKKSLMTRIVDTIENCVELSIGKEFRFIIMKNLKKIQTGSIIIKVIVYLEETPEKQRSILFIIDKDIVTSLIHVSIVDDNEKSPSILFTTNITNPISKLEKYIPSIIMSTQDIIK
jgi:hypothetical protein